jgi:multidrug transporter EmrE-like cation transporter
MLACNLFPGHSLPGTASRMGDLLHAGSRERGWMILFVLAAGPTVAGFGLYNLALRDLPASVVNLVVTTEPIFTAVIAYVILGERLRGVEVLGGLVIIAGVVVLRLGERERSTPCDPGPSSCCPAPVLREQALTCQAHVRSDRSLP